METRRLCNHCFNTQPPEGGWAVLSSKIGRLVCCFNTQPPEGGWKALKYKREIYIVSTHSRPKAAGGLKGGVSADTRKFQHTAARRRLGYHHL